MSDNSENQGRRMRGSGFTIFILILIVAALLAACVYLFIGYQKAVDARPKTDAGRIAEITKRLAETVVLPDEQPTIATVADHAKLNEPELAAQAKDGDEILVYAKTKRVILYRPSLQKVVDMFRVNTTTTTSGAETPSLPANPKQ